MIPIESNFQMLSIDEIELDYSNPRIAAYLEMYGDDINTEQMALALGAGASYDGNTGPSFIGLKQSILTSGGIIHPIIVNRDENNKNIVIEGNTRTLIYRDFKANNVRGNWDLIPSIVHEQLDDQIIDAIRLQAHLVGPRDWDAYAKAKYLNYLRHKQHLTFAQIVDFCGGNTNEIENYIKAYQDMERFYRPILDSDQNFDQTRFSAFVELQRPRVLEAIINHGFTKGDFSRWVNDRRISPLNTVRQLPRIMENDNSREIFLAEGAQEAIKSLTILTSDVNLGNATLEQLARELCKRISHIEYNTIMRLRNNPDCEEVMVLCLAKDSLDDFCEEFSTGDD